MEMAINKVKHTVFRSAFPAEYFSFNRQLKLVGREEDLAELALWLRHRSQDDLAVLLLEGEAGIGKTAFANQLIMESGSVCDFCVYGKFHNSPAKVPYLALRQCIHHWLDQLLQLKDHVFERLKQHLKQAIHPHEHVLTSVLPELEVVIGKSINEDYRSDPQKDRHRFTYFFYKFLLALHQSGLRTVIFLDDLQWADMATLHLLHDLTKNYSLPALSLVGAFRPVKTNDPRKELLENLKSLPQVKHYVLSPLKLQEIQQLIPLDWKLEKDEKKAFTEYLIQESGGRPFDALQLLSLVSQENLISTPKGGSQQILWKKLPRFNHDERSVGLVMKEIMTLKVSSIRLLQLASCIGYYFSCRMLHQLSGTEDHAFEEALSLLIDRKMIVTQGEVCYFVHDHYFTASQTILPKEEKLLFHAKIAQYMIQEGALDMHHPDFFSCTNHINLGGSEVIVLDKLALAVINLSAAELAKKRAAFDKSLEYYRQAEVVLSGIDDGLLLQKIQLPDFIPEYDWLPVPLIPANLKYVCKLGIAECEFLVQNFLLSDQLLHYILQHVDNRKMRLKAYTIKMKICIACLNLKDAPIMLKDGMGITEALLRDYQIALPQTLDEYEQWMNMAYHEFMSLIPNDGFDQLENYPLSEDQEFHELIQLIVHSLPIIFFVDIHKSKYLAVKSMILCMQNGFAPSTPALFASSIWTLASVSQEYELAYQLGLLGLRLVEKEAYKFNRHAVYHLATLNYYNWKNHYRESAARLDEAVEYSLQLGDHNYALFCFTNARLLDLFRGLPLSQHAWEIGHTKSGLLNIHFIGISHALYVRHLTREDSSLVEGKIFLSRRIKQQVTENTNAAYHFHFVKEQLYMHSGQYTKAFKAAMVCEQNRMLYEGLPIGNEHDFYFCLILCLLAEEQGHINQEYRSIIETRLLDFRRLAEMGSGNYLHKQKFLEAELARFDKNYFEALSLYDEAIEEAVRQEFIHLSALASERAGDLLMRHKKPRLAETYLIDAYQYYEQWGAQAKMKILKIRYPAVSFRSKHAASAHSRTEAQEVVSWDLLQSAVQLSQELYANELISKVLQISVEQTKATMATFMLNQPFNWQVVARLDEEGLSLVHQNLPTGSQLSPHKTINDCLQLNEICYVPRLSDRHDLYDVDYFKHKLVHSFMAIPILRHQEVLGMIYLENVDTQLVEYNRLLAWFELLRMQSGIALSNAQLFENQQKLNQEIKKQEQKRTEAIVETQEKERKRVAAELHDHLGQMMALVKLNFSRLEDSLERQFGLYEETSHLLDESCVELRRIAHDMMPPDLERRDLGDILDDLFRKYLNGAGLSYQFHRLDLPDKLSSAIKFNLYRMAQEIIHNIIKHAQAREVLVEISANEGKLHLMIADDGKGFDTQFKTNGLGLRNLHNRASMLHGRMDIDSGLSKGTVFHIHIPIL